MFKIVRGIVGAVRAAATSTEEPNRVRDLEARLAEAIDRASSAERRVAEYQDACRSYERQRDGWIDRYHKQAQQHHAGEVYLARVVEAQKVMLATALKQINELRSALRLEPLTIKRGSDFDGNPLRVPEDFLAKQRVLIAEAKTLFACPENAVATGASNHSAK